MIDEVEALAAKLRQMLDGIAAESGVTVVSVRGKQVCRKFGANPVIAGKALRAAGFWMGEDMWRAVAGARYLQLDFESAEDGTTSGA